MMKDLWNTIKAMKISDVKQMIDAIEEKDKVISLEERFKLFFGLLSMNCLDSALFQFQFIYEEIKNNGINKDFGREYFDFKTQLISRFQIWEDECGNIHIGPDEDPCEDCFTMLSFCCCNKGTIGVFAVLFCVAACCGQDGMNVLMDWTQVGLDAFCNCCDSCAGWCVDCFCCCCGKH